MAAKAAQLAEWLKELQDRVNEDGNISTNEISRFVKEKSLTPKQLDGIYNLLNEHHIDIVYDEDEMTDEEPDDADFNGLMKIRMPKMPIIAWQPVESAIRYGFTFANAGQILF